MSWSWTTFWDWFAWTMIAVDLVCVVAMGRWLIKDLRGQRHEMHRRWDRTARELDERRARMEEITRKMRLLMTVHSTVRVRRYDAEGRLVSDGLVGEDAP